MNLRVEYEDLDVVGYDAGGGEIIEYQGQSFTGTIVQFIDGILIGEEEFSNGHKGGIQRNYFLNGALQDEYSIYFNKLEGTFRSWDENGILISETIWRDGESIKVIV